MQSFEQNYKYLTLGPKMSNLGVFRLQLKKNKERKIIAIFEVSNL